MRSKIKLWRKQAAHQKTTEIAAPTTTNTSTSTSSSTMPTAGGEEKKKGNEQRKKKERQLDMEEVEEIESDVESNSAMEIDEPAEEAANKSPATGKVTQLGSG